jgi:hypothetical protein
LTARLFGCVCADLSRRALFWKRLWGGLFFSIFFCTCFVQRKRIVPLYTGLLSMYRGHSTTVGEVRMGRRRVGLQSIREITCLPRPRSRTSASQLHLKWSTPSPRPPGWPHSLPSRFEPLSRLVSVELRHCSFGLNEGNQCARIIVHHQRP